MRFAGEKLQEIEDNEVLPNTKGVSYPQDKSPAGEFGGEVNPTELPMMRQEYMRSPQGGIAQLAPQMVDGYVDHPAVQDTGLPYIVSPEIQRLRRQSMDTFQSLPSGTLNQFGFKGV